MSRIARRNWALTAGYPDALPITGLLSSMRAYAGKPSFRLELREVTPAQAQQIVSSLDRGSVSVSDDYSFSYGGLVLRNIEVTEAEARKIAEGADPLDVLLGVSVSESGVRLTVVPDAEVFG